MSIAQTYVELPALSGNPQIDVQQLIAHARSGHNIVPLTQAPRVPDARAENIREISVRPARVSRSRLTALAAAIGVIGAVGVLLLWIVSQRYQTYSTDVGERRSVTLVDGSTIDLNARSKVRVAFSKAQRDVQLIEGQALFEVAKDRARPFIVHSGAVLVRAVGTQFTVYKKKSGTVVTVVEGRVAVQRDRDVVADFRRNASTDGASGTDSPRGRAVQTAATFLSTGQELTVMDGAVTEPQHANIAAATAWLQHRLIFDDSPLSDVTDDFNRYNSRQFVIEDRALGDLHISGVYSSTDPTSLIRFLRDQPGIQVIETDKAVRIARK